MGTKTKRNRKKLLLLLIPVVIIILGVLAFQLRDGNVTMKISLGDGFTKLFEVDAGDITLTSNDPKQTSKAKRSFSKEIVVKLSDVGYDFVTLRIPAKIKSSNKAATINVNYIKANNWYRTTLKLKIDASKEGKTAKTSIDVNVDEKGLGSFYEWRNYDADKNLAIDLEKGGNYETGFGL